MQGTCHAPKDRFGEFGALRVQKLSFLQSAGRTGQRKVTQNVTRSRQPCSIITCPDTSAWMRWRLLWAPISDITASTSPGLMWVM